MKSPFYQIVMVLISLTITLSSPSQSLSEAPREEPNQYGDLKPSLQKELLKNQVYVNAHMKSFHDLTQKKQRLEVHAYGLHPNKCQDALNFLHQYSHIEGYLLFFSLKINLSFHLLQFHHPFLLSFLSKVD